MKNIELDKARRDLNKSHAQITRVIEKETEKLAVILKKIPLEKRDAKDRLNYLPHHERIMARSLAANIIRHKRMEQNLSRMEQGLLKTENLSKKIENLTQNPPVKPAQVRSPAPANTNPKPAPANPKYRVGREVSDKEFDKLADEFADTDFTMDIPAQPVAKAQPAPKYTPNASPLLGKASVSVPKASSQRHIEQQVEQMMKDAEKTAGHGSRGLKEELLSAHKETKSTIGDLKKSANRWQQHSDKLLQSLPKSLKDVGKFIREVTTHDSHKTPPRPKY